MDGELIFQAPQGTYRLLLKGAAQPGGVVLAQRQLREPGPQEALVRIRRAAICGTDLHIVHWNEWAAAAYKPPFALGHEFSGDVIAAGTDVTSVAVGDKVAGETHLACGRCTQCLMGRGHTCLNLRVFSRLDQGAFAEYAVVPAQLLHVMPAALSHRHACLMEPLGIAVRAVAECDVQDGALLVSGCGPIGLLAIAAARAMGITSIAATDLSPARLELALSLGAGLAADPRNANTARALRDAATEGGYAAVVEASGSAMAINSVLPLIRPGGTLMLAGMPAGEVALDLARHVILREVMVRGLYGRRLDGTWDQALALMPRLGPALDKIITHEFGLGDYGRAFEAALSGHAGKVQFSLE